jgi:Ca2+-binding EF-hand superfamily protein
MNTRRFSILAAGVGMMLAGISMAQPRNMEFPISIEAAEARAADAFVKADTDSNGKITAEEFAAMEMPKHHRGHPPHRGFRHGPGMDRPLDGEPDETARAQRRAEHEAALFETLDTNGDSKLSADEFSHERQREARRTLMKERAFAHMDTNGDGVLTQDEFPRSVARLKGLDANGDGEVSRDELRAGVHARFHQSS